eukprot:158944-Heterocapsa_arctica.AAC.1
MASTLSAACAADHEVATGSICGQSSTYCDTASQNSRMRMISATYQPRPRPPSFLHRDRGTFDRASLPLKAL